MANREKFSQRHPFLFGLSLILMAVVLFLVATAIFRLLPAIGLVPEQAKLGEVRIEGSIDDSRRTVDWIEELRADDSVKGVLIRIESPGGGVVPSQEIHAAVQRVSKPVVVSMGQAAASGGYYVASAADQIVANPGTLTGSIGVSAQVVNLQEMMDKLGVSEETMVSGEYKDAGSPSKPLTDRERRYFQDLVDDLHTQFVDAVVRGRNLEREKVRELADGRAFTGGQALDKGLVDVLGSREKAKEILLENTGLTEPVDFRTGPERDVSLLRLLLDWLGFHVGSEFTRDRGWIVRY